MNSLYAPKYWPTWVGLGVVRLVALLPYPVIFHSGRLLGAIGYYSFVSRRRIAMSNLRICFPDKSERWYRDMLKQHFRSLGIALLEISLAWWGSEKKIRALTHIEGLEHLQAAMAEGKGVILLAAHFTSLEITGRCLLTQADFHSVYRRSDNPVLETVVAKQRNRWTGKAIPKDSIRGMIKSLRGGHAVWYAPDQNASRKQGVFVKFFDEWASTNTGTARLAKMTGARVVPFKGVRREDGRGFQIQLEPALENYPTGNLEVDTQTINDVIERWARGTPSQYLWIHRRFRTRPNRGDPAIYT
ncbi:MAG: LpxL/LpxP family Kdo(2)-lipid IV(A) lauroyl/palmitoleoyl acyltransferase [bacterium]